MATQAMDKRNYGLADAIAEAEAGYARANPNSAGASERSQGSMPGGNTRTTLHFNPFPLTITSAEEGWLYDADGHRYADFVNEYSAGIFGHSSPVIMDALRGVLDTGINLGGPNRYEADLAERIVERFPSIDMLRFCNSGTEANQLALGTARAITGRDKVMVFDGAYHGSLFYFHHGASPINAPFDVVMGQFNDWAATKRVLDEHGQKIAAVIVEPMQGASGCLAGDPEFLRQLRAACTEHGIILIFDEVMTSRLSSGGLQKLLGVTPDMTTLGKYIGGGVSLAAFGGKTDVMMRFDPRSPSALPHGGTFNNNILAMAAGVAAFDKLLTPEALDRMNSYGDTLRDRLNAFARAQDLPLRVTGIGSLIGLHFFDGEINNVRDLEKDAARVNLAGTLGRLLHFDLLDKGFYAASRGYMALSLATTAEQIKSMGDAIEDFLVARAPMISNEFAVLD